MSSTDRRPLHAHAPRARGTRLLLVVGAVCLAAVLIEVAVLWGVPPWLSLHRTAPGPNLNPYDDKILGIPSEVTYLGSSSGYFPAVSGVDLCAHACPELPRIWVDTQGPLPPEVGVHFWVNVTNTANIPVNLSVPVLSTSGPDATLFILQTFCCYTTTNTPYDELIDSPVHFPADFTFGIEGYIYTTVPLPESPSGGFTVYVNYTAD